MKKDKGFVATSLVITIVMLVSAIVFLILNKHNNNHDLTQSISNNAKAKLSEAKYPNCFWGATPFLGITGAEQATSSIVLSCTHVDNIATELETLLTKDTIASYVEIKNSSGTQTLALTINWVKVLKVTNGYKILIEVGTAIEGDYYITLRENKICTADNYCNSKITSKAIKAERQ